MATRTPPDNGDTREKLILAATREFFNRGYDGASLRQICAAAGVTTGALYFFFKNKEDLFRNVIAPVTRPMHIMLEGTDEDGGIDALSLECDIPLSARNATVVRRFLSLCYEQRPLVQIMVRNRENPVMERVIAEATEAFSQNVRLYLTLRNIELTIWDDFVVNWLAAMALNSLLKVLEEDETLEQACAHTQVIVEFVRGGVHALNERTARGGA